LKSILFYIFKILFKTIFPITDLIQ